jgi:hypothetical protein
MHACRKDGHNTCSDEIIRSVVVRALHWHDTWPHAGSGPPCQLHPCPLGRQIDNHRAGHCIFALHARFGKVSAVCVLVAGSSWECVVCFFWTTQYNSDTHNARTLTSMNTRTQTLPLWAFSKTKPANYRDWWSHHRRLNHVWLWVGRLTCMLPRLTKPHNQFYFLIDMFLSGLDRREHVVPLTSRRVEMCAYIYATCITLQATQLALWCSDMHVSMHVVL